MMQTGNKLSITQDPTQGRFNDGTCYRPLKIANNGDIK